MYLQTIIGPADGHQVILQTRPYLTRSDDFFCKLTVEAGGIAQGKNLDLDEVTALHAMLASVISAWPVQ